MGVVLNCGSFLTGVDALVTSKERLGLFRNCEGLNGSCFMGVFSIFIGVIGLEPVKATLSCNKAQS